MAELLGEKIPPKTTLEDTPVQTPEGAEPNNDAANEIDPKQANKDLENINQEAFQQTLEKLSVIMKNYDKLPPTEQDKFAKNLASVKKEVGEVFSNLIQHTSTPEKTPNRENAEQINKEVSSSTVESLVTNEQQARRAADLAMEYVNKNPQILAQLSFLIKHNHELPPDQQKTLHDTLGKIKGDIDTIYNTIQQKIE